jgi:hypothetical protein
MSRWLPDNSRTLQDLGQGLSLRVKKLLTLHALRAAMTSEQTLLDRNRVSCLLGIVQFGWDAFMQTHRITDTPNHRHSDIQTHTHSITCIFL